jgi:uncharacterized membrane-anchored protein
LHLCIWHASNLAPGTVQVAEHVIGQHQYRNGSNLTDEQAWCAHPHPSVLPLPMGWKQIVLEGQEVAR